ncbi:putative phage tail protein [Paracoccus sp. (in: a-proteobacteria)]|uniref:putative phage tail protein n=1 Tax=Paracoccus sp. TaxID=267 RepID=UPI002AFFD570|nr:putative phage tail protein [Paracoccus sp. (in: a-proteobacteria)]
MRDSALNTWTYYIPPEGQDEVMPAGPWDALAAPEVEDLLPAAMTLWPRGAIWGTPDGLAPPSDSVLAKFTRVLLVPFVALYRQAWQLTQESRASSLIDSLDDWEADYGLPDRCTAGDTSFSGRRQALLSRVRAVAVITPQDFIRLARQAGYDIAIEEPAVFECGFSQCGGEHTVGDLRQEVFWNVHVYGLTVTYFICGESEVSVDPLFEIGGIGPLICLFRRLYPAWTQPVYIVHDWTQVPTLFVDEWPRLNVLAAPNATVEIDIS